MRRWGAALLAALLALTACAAPEEPAEEPVGLLLYYLAPEEEARGGDRIRGVYEPLDLPEDAGTAETARAVVERLLLGSSDGTLSSPLPGGTELLGLEIRDRRACVDLSSSAGQLSGVELAMADYCVTLSLTGLEGIGSVSVTVQGRSIGQQPKQVFYERDVLLSDMDDVLQTVEVTLYFLNGEGALTGGEPGGRSAGGAGEPGAAAGRPRWLRRQLRPGGQRHLLRQPARRLPGPPAGGRGGPAGHPVVAGGEPVLHRVRRGAAPTGRRRGAEFLRVDPCGERGSAAQGVSIFDF